MAYFGNSLTAAGDPGFFDTIKRGLVGGVTGFLGGGPLGAVGGAGTAILRHGGGSAIATTARRGAAVGLGVAAGTVFAGTRPQLGGMVNVPGLTGAVQRFVPGGASGMMGVPRGFHLAKDGSGRMVRNRSRNVYNRKAATRAASRLRGLGRGMKSIKKSVAAAHKELK